MKIGNEKVNYAWENLVMDVYNNYDVGGRYKYNRS